LKFFVEARPPGVNNFSIEERDFEVVGRGRSPKLAVIPSSDSRLVAAAKSAGLSPRAVESYDR